MKISQINNSPNIKEFLLREFPSSKILFPSNIPAKDKKPSKLRKVIGVDNKIKMWLETFNKSNKSNGNLSNSMILFRIRGHNRIGRILRMDGEEIHVLYFYSYRKYEGKDIYIPDKYERKVITSNDIVEFFASTIVGDKFVIFTKN